MGGYGAGFIFGPVIGGILYDGWGFAAPFVTSAVLALIAFSAAGFLVPETRPREVRRRDALRKRWASGFATAAEGSFLASLPRPLYVFGTLLTLDFVGIFAFAFVEPQMIFYFYEELGWTTTRFGIVVGAYGLAMVFGQTILGRSSDRFGRKPVIILGILLTATFYAGLAFVSQFSLMLLVAAVAGLGAALIAPALSSYYLDITDERHRARVVGIKESSAALGGVVGPLLLVGASTLIMPRGVFIIAGVVTLAAAGLALAALGKPQHVPDETTDIEWECSDKRSMAAQASLRGVVVRASATRGD